MKDSERLIARLRREGADLPPCTELYRTNRNRQTGIGAWSWFAYCPHALDGGPEHDRHADLHYGSHWPMRMLLAAPALIFTRQDWGDICVDPVPEPRELYRQDMGRLAELSGEVVRLTEEEAPSSLSGYRRGRTAAPGGPE